MVNVHYILCESHERDKETYENPNHFRLHLQNPLREVKRVELVNLRVPNTLYVIDDNVDLISISSSSSTTSMKTFSIPRGHYSPSALALELTRAVYNITLVQIAWRSDLGKFFFYRSASTVDFNVTINTTELQNVMGFTDGLPRVSYEVPSQPISDSNFVLYANNATYGGYKILFSDQLANTNNFGYIYLDIEELRSTRVECAGRLGDSGVAASSSRFSFAPILVDADAGNFLTFFENSGSSSAIDFTPRIAKMDRLTINWKNREGELIDFNGRDANSFMLRVICE